MSVPRHDIRSHLDAIIAIASEADPRGVDSALNDVPGAWDVSSITQQRHGYGYHAVIECGAAGYPAAYGYGQSIGAAIRAASAVIREREQDNVKRQSTSEVVQNNMRTGNG